MFTTKIFGGAAKSLSWLSLSLWVAFGSAACTNNCLRRGANGECEVTCNQWKDGQCVHSCTKGLACD